MGQEFMGKTFDEALTEDEKVWLQTWDKHDLIAANEAEYGDAGVDQDDDDEDEGDDYDSWKVAELEAEVAKRNKGRDEDDLIEPESGRKADLIAALREDDEPDTEE